MIQSDLVSWNSQARNPLRRFTPSWLLRALGCEGIVSKGLGSPYRSGRSAHWVKVKNPAAPAVKREAEEDWGNKRWSHARR